MSKIVALILCVGLIFTLSACAKEFSLSTESALGFIDTSYYEEVEYEKTNFSGINRLIPFRQFDATPPSEPLGIPSSLFKNFPVIKTFKDLNNYPVFVNGKKYKKGQTLKFSVLYNAESKDVLVNPTLVFIRHEELNGVETYNSIRLNPESFSIPLFECIDEDAEFGERYFAYNYLIKGEISDDQLTLPVELFTTEVGFAKAGHYTVAVVDGYKNDGKYTDKLILQIN